jgi:hypothetical protein
LGERTIPRTGHTAWLSFRTVHLVHPVETLRRIVAELDTLRPAAKQIEIAGGARRITMSAEHMIWIALSEEDPAAARALEAAITSNGTELLEA